MQPTFLPWLGYFSLIDKVDEFIFLDNVQFDKRSWQQRNKIKTKTGASWLSVPVLSRGRSEQLLKDVQILKEGKLFPLEKIKRAIQQNYSKSQYFEDYSARIFQIMDTENRLLCNLNIKLIEEMCHLLKINTNLKKASDLDCSGSKASLLVNICKKVGADTYISPPGSKGYLDETDLFELEGIQINYHEYNHPKYQQRFKDFLPYMSIIDLVFNMGHESISTIRSGNI